MTTPCALLIISLSSFGLFFIVLLKRGFNYVYIYLIYLIIKLLYFNAFFAILLRPLCYLTMEGHRFDITTQITMLSLILEC